MTRICDPFAYGEGPLESCFWAETVSIQNRLPLSGHAEREVAVVGAGVTGLNTALRLAQAGVSVAVVDAKQVGWGASGRNGGFCCLGGAKASHTSLRKRFGQEALSDYLQTERAAVDHVEQLLSQHAWQVDRHSKGETLLAHNPRVAATLPAEAAEFERTYGLKSQVIDASDLAGHGLGTTFCGALTLPIGFALNPRKYLKGLADAAEAAGAEVYCDTKVSEITQVAGRWQLRTPQGNLSAKKLVIATNGYSSEHIPAWLAGRYLPAQSSVIVTRVLTKSEQQMQNWTSTQMAYDSRNLLHYFRLLPDGRFLFGMRGGLATTHRAHSAIKQQIKQDFARLFPAWAAVETPHFWSGFVCYSRALTPFAGAVPGAKGLYAAFAYHGNGLAMGSYAGALLTQDILGGCALRHPDIMRATPGRFPLGRARRLLMYPAYLFYKLKDL
ncbi:NAD(P)/FAD-dependent oxidoreductase [Shimia sp. MMG029]|uniref:NAD(P)/FAD-dependent oxidoreductase n=1 Tax=Shimia sp. MMG029 TaxID=3021978 RepID=UPI0022FE5F08|nr:FAD-dependent oxidoreductase [Shimia sp. MMG029]MDA5557418.1 FAD-dependent oxidoreductase [Shimia sp. MMG029]